MKQLQPHQALPEGIPLGQAVPVQKHDGTGRMSPPKRRRAGMVLNSRLMVGLSFYY
jgi:hypothetical protein